MGPELCFLIPSYLAMKKIALALCSAVTALMSQGVSAHGMTQNDLMNLTEAYAYVYQRQQVLAAAEKQFGNDVGVLGVVDTSRLTWNLIYPDAENALITHLGHFGLSRADIAKLTAETLGASDKNLRFRDAIQAKAVVLHYSLVSKSPTEKENRVRRTLSDAAFSAYPEEEFAFHRTAHEIKYPLRNTAGEKKFRILIPDSWEETPTSFPGHIGYWTKNDEDVVVSIGARRPVDDEYNPADFIYRNLKAIEGTPEIGKRFGPLGSELVKKGPSKVVIFDRTPVILLEWDGKFARDNTPFYTHTTSAIYQDGSQYVDVEFYVASRDPEAAKRAGNKYQMLRDQILSSIRLVSADK